jgi:hypothetical protein
VDAAATAIRGEVARLRALAGTGPDAIHESGRVPPPAGSLLLRSLNTLARQYFLAAARPPEFAAGPLPADVRQGRAGRADDGVSVLFELRTSPAENAGRIVKSARFSVYGCPHTVAVTAWLCEVLEGSRLDAAPPGTPRDWAQKFEVPVEKLGRLLVVEDALRAAITP